MGGYYTSTLHNREVYCTLKSSSRQNVLTEATHGYIVYIKPLSSLCMGRSPNKDSDYKDYSIFGHANAQYNLHERVVLIDILLSVGCTFYPSRACNVYNTVSEQFSPLHFSRGVFLHVFWLTHTRIHFISWCCMNYMD